MNSLEFKFNSFKWKSIQINNSEVLNKNAFIYQKDKIINKLNKIGVADQLENCETNNLIMRNENKKEELNIKLQVNNNMKTPLIDKNDMEEDAGINVENKDLTQQKNAVLIEFDYKNANLSGEGIIKDKIIQEIIEEEKGNHEEKFNISENKNTNKHIRNKEHNYTVYKNNLDFVRKITFEDIKNEHLNDDVRNLNENENLKDLLKEKYILISIFCEFQANKTYVDYLLFLLVSITNIIIIIKHGGTKGLENVILFIVSIVMLLFYLVFTCNLYTKFDEIIFNNKNNNAIKFFFMSKYNMFSINYFKDLKRIDEGYERYSSLSNSNKTISNRSLSNENECRFEKLNSNMYRNRLNKLTISDEKFINNHLTLNLFFKILKCFFEGNEKYYLKQEYSISTHPDFNIIKEERKSFINNSMKNNNANGSGFNRNSNLKVINGNRDLISVFQNISESSANSFHNIKKKLNFSFKKFFNKIEDFEIRNFIEKKQRNDVLANTVADENFIMNNNIAEIEFKIEYLFSEFTHDLLTFFDVRIKDILEALDPIKNKNVCKILAEKKKNEANYNCFFTHDNFLYFEIYDTYSDYFKNLNNFIEKYSLYMRENILNWNHTYIPLILGIFKINFMNFEKIIVLYRHPCAFSIFKDFKYWINIALTDNNENVTISTTSQTQIIDVKLIEVIDNISFHPSDFDEFYEILRRDMEFLKRIEFNPEYSFNIFVLNDFKNFLNDSESSNNTISENNLNIFAQKYNANRNSLQNNRISVKSLYRNVNGLFNINSNLIWKNLNANSDANTNMNFNQDLKDDSKSMNNFHNKDILNEILSKLDKSELIKDENTKNNYAYKKLFGSETISSLERINDYINLYDRYTIKFYFSNILSIPKPYSSEENKVNEEIIRGKYLVYFYLILIRIHKDKK